MRRGRCRRPVAACPASVHPLQNHSGSFLFFLEVDKDKMFISWIHFDKLHFRVAIRMASGCIVGLLSAVSIVQCIPKLDAGLSVTQSRIALDDGHGS